MKKRNSILLKVAVSAALSCLASVILIFCISTGLRTFLVGLDKDFYTKIYYDIHNRTTMSMPESDDIVIFDIGDYKSRTEIAEAIGCLAACKPAVVLLDIFMAENDELKESADSAITAAFLSMDFPIVSPCLYNDLTNELEYPFYRNYVDSTKHFFASPVAFDMAGSFRAKDPRNNNVTASYKAASIFTDLYGYPLGYSDDFMVNYRNKGFFPLVSKEELEPDFIDGKIVIIGDCKDYLDIHSTPFKVMSSNFIPGVVTIAYIVNSMISTGTYCNDKGYEGMRTRYNAPFHRCGTFINLLLSYLLCFAFSYCSYILTDLSRPDDRKFKRLVLIIVPMFITIFVELLLMITCFEIVTSLLMLIPDIFLFMTSVLFVTTSNSLVNELFSKKITTL
ncbi:MAG: CHASE2 domain-containing protein [Bacteroidales bacterium]|nr:CHASE2 domain-containing protein [Candidatus Hennigimonas equi]